jgi:hypothetical protein
MRAADQTSSGVFGGMIRGTIEAFEAGTGMELPYGSPNAARRAMHGMEQGLLDTEARSARMVATAQSREVRAGMRDERVLSRISNEHERAVAAAEMGADAVGRKYRVGLLERQRAMADAPDGSSRVRAGAELNRYVRDESQTVMDAQRNAQASVDALRREDRFAAGLTNTSVRGLLSGVEGNFGLAAERDFEAGLKRNAMQASRQGPLQYAAVLGINLLERAARKTANDFETGEIESDARVNRAMQMFDEEGAIREQGDRDRKNANAWYRTASQRDALLERANSREANLMRRHKLGRMAETDDLMLQRDVSGIMADTSKSLGTAAQLAQVQTIFGRARNGADVLGAMGLHQQANLVRETGANDLQAMRRQLMAGVGGQEVSVNRFAAGGEDVLSVLRAIEKNTADLKATSGATAQ